MKDVSKKQSMTKRQKWAKSLVQWLLANMRSSNLVIFII